jgi:hypothetical protein
VTVARPMSGLVAGAGFLLNKKSAGFLAGELGLRSHFGFDVKFDKNGVVPPQGNLTALIRSYYLPDGTRDSVLHTYQVKSSSITSLLASSDSAGKRLATLVAIADVRDITDPLNPFTVASGLAVEMTTTDAGVPGTNNDSLGLRLWNGSSLWFSSNYNAGETLEQLLSGGNVKIA